MLIHPCLIFGMNNLLLFYNSSIIGDIYCNEKFNYNNEYILENFKQKLEEKKSEEIIRAQSVIGAHRDDISFYINNKLLLLKKCL